jgi:hypothetical protein
MSHSTSFQTEGTEGSKHGGRRRGALVVLALTWTVAAADVDARPGSHRTSFTGVWHFEGSTYCEGNSCGPYQPEAVTETIAIVQRGSALVARIGGVDYAGALDPGNSLAAPTAPASQPCASQPVGPASCAASRAMPRRSFHHRHSWVTRGRS